MIVKVERLFGGNYRLSFSIDGKHYRESMPEGNHDCWNRTHSKKALDLLENVYHVPRKKIRFSN